MIFCVEDDSAIRELMTYTLAASGFDTVGLAGTTLYRITRALHHDVLPLFTCALLSVLPMILITLAPVEDIIKLNSLPDVGTTVTVYFPK